MAEQRSRLFFALWPNDALREQLGKQAVPDGVVCKPVPVANWHVTLAFLGDVDRALEPSLQQLAASVRSEPLTLCFDQLSYWPSAAIACLTCRQAPLSVIELATALAVVAKACGLPADSRPYRPHITLARHCAAFADQNFEPIVWRADAFALFESCRDRQNSGYRMIQQWPLGN